MQKEIVNKLKCPIFCVSFSVCHSDGALADFKESSEYFNINKKKISIYKSDSERKFIFEMVHNQEIKFTHLLFFLFCLKDLIEI